MMNRIRSGAGFTLLEILVALAIFSAILVLLLSAFSGVAKTREFLADRYGKSRQVGMTLDRIGSDLAGIVAASALPETHVSCSEDDFSGQPGATLSFTAYTLPADSADRPSSALNKIRYYPKVSAEGGFLELYREQSDLALIENRLPTRESRVARRIRGFRIELHDGTSWRTEWPPGPEKKGALPQKIAVTLTDENGKALRREISVPLSGREAQLLFSGRRPKP